jgi:hypothetical protein
LCQPMAPELLIIKSGNFGGLPFFGQLSSKRLPASTRLSVVPELKAQ